MITHLLFDLDNTLYSARSGLEDNVGRRIREYLAAWLGLSPEAAAQERRDRIKDYGSTLEWLMTEKGFTEVEHYYAAIHPADEARSLQPDPALRPFLESLRLPRAIMTNSPREHADRILARLEIADLFLQIYDSRWNSFKGKPHPEAYHRVLESLGSKPETTLLIDDYPLYVDGYRAIGGAALLYDELNAHPGYPHPRITKLSELTRYL